MHGVTHQECQAALRATGGDVVSAIRNLKVKPDAALWFLQLPRPPPIAQHSLSPLPSTHYLPPPGTHCPPCHPAGGAALPSEQPVQSRLPTHPGALPVGSLRGQSLCPGSALSAAPLGTDTGLDGRPGRVGPSGTRTDPTRAELPPRGDCARGSCSRSWGRAWASISSRTRWPPKAPASLASS